jgi:ribosomal-protein-alanine N-acetyltransferase
VNEAIETRRLQLRTMGPEFLRASLAGDRRRAESLVGASLPEDWPDDPGLLEMRLGQLEADPALEPWLTRVIELRSGGEVIGVTGFHGPPGGDWLAEFAPGGLEFGYTVFTRWRRQGIAFEASEALMSWAWRTTEVTAFVLSIQPDNEASIGLARRLGFSKVGSWQHKVRGVEHVYRLDPPREGVPARGLSPSPYPI